MYQLRMSSAWTNWLQIRLYYKIIIKKRDRVYGTSWETHDMKMKKKNPIRNTIGIWYMLPPKFKTNDFFQLI